MKIEELIKQLQDIQVNYPNLDIYIGSLTKTDIEADLGMRIFDIDELDDILLDDEEELAKGNRFLLLVTSEEEV